MIWPAPPITSRGTLQPKAPAVDTVECMICGAYYVPDRSQPGCPGCELQRRISGKVTR
jgi:hypothetical protein